MQRERFRGLFFSHCNATAASVSAVVLLSAFLLNVWHCTISSIIMILGGIILYLLFALLNNDVFNNKAIFSGIWLCSIGLALLRLNLNQVPWSNKTWICLFVAYISFLFGYSVLEKKKSQKFNVVDQISKSTFFAIIIINFMLSVIAFVAEVVIIGFIPAFTRDQAAYVGFYVKGLHYFTVSIVIFIPLSILYVKKYIKETSKISIAILVICSMVALTIPIFIVSRQLGLLQTILSLLAVYYNSKLSKKKILSMAIIIAIGASNWIIISNLRNQDDRYLREVFDEPVVAREIPEEKDEPRKDLYSNNVAEWPMCIYHPYMYISFNFDNFNYSVSKIDRWSKGIYTLHPIVHMSPLIRLYNKYPMYVYNSIYNTYPVIYPPYYDFGIIGIFIYMFLIGMLSRFSSTWDRNDPFLQVIRYLIKFALMFSFFASFFANTAFLFYIVILLVMSFASNGLRRFRSTKK